MTNDYVEVPAVAGFAGTDAALRAFKVASLDPFELTRTAHDWSFDPMVADGHAGGAVPASGTALPAGGLVNLANDAALALPVDLRRVATAKVRAGTVLNVADTGAGRIGLTDPAQNFGRGLVIQKTGLADNLVGHPPTEGWRDFLQLAWFRPAAVGYQGIFGYGAPGQRFYGLLITGGGNLSETLSGKPYAALAPNTWTQLAAHYRFAAGSIYVRTFANGAEQNAGTAGAAIATSQATLAGWSTVSGICMLAGNFVDPSVSGAIGAADRIFTGLAGHTLDPAELVAADWAAKRARYGV